MKHWLFVGSLIILGVVFVLRSKIAPTGVTLPTTRGITVAQLNEARRLATQPIGPEHVIGVPVSKIKGIKLVAPTTAPSQSIFDQLRVSRSAKLDEQLDVAPTYDVALERAVPSELLLVRCQPAVYRILEYGDIDIRIPGDVTIDTPALAAAHDKAEAANSLRLGDDPARVAFYWDQIAADPDAYLASTNEQSVKSMPNTLMASGTGFLVSRDGIVLTNAHVISDMPDEPLTSDPMVLVGLLGPQVDVFVENASKLLGHPPTAEQTPAVAMSLVRWFGEHGRMTATFNHAELALHLDKKKLTATQIVKAKDIDELLNRPAEPITCPLTVLSKGTVLPGKDVAILRAEAGGSFDVLDRAICLPLGDSDDVLPGARVQAMGFPGIAFSADLMKPEAEYRVSAADGQIANTKRMNGDDSGDWDAFEMTADINHGDSGGPVITADGKVIALNVGAAQGNKSVGHTLAVPINLARAMLDELEIKPDPGPVTALWLDGLKKYADQDYAGAAERFDRIVSIQSQWQTVDGPVTQPTLKSLSLGYEPSVNPYVTDMLKRARAKVGKKD